MNSVVKEAAQELESRLSVENLTSSTVKKNMSKRDECTEPLSIDGDIEPRNQLLHKKSRGYQGTHS